MIVSEDLDYFLEDLRKRNPLKSLYINKEVADIFLSKGLVRKENIQPNGVYDLVITDFGLSFRGFVEEEKIRNRNKWLDELNERAVKSAEHSAKAAEESAVSAKDSVRAANEANLISRTSKTYSFWAMVAAIVSCIFTLIGLLFSFFKQ